MWCLIPSLERRLHIEEQTNIAVQCDSCIQSYIVNSFSPIQLPSLPVYQATMGYLFSFRFWLVGTVLVQHTAVSYFSKEDILSHKQCKEVQLVLVRKTTTPVYTSVRVSQYSLPHDSL